jgi:hypothetical protein
LNNRVIRATAVILALAFMLSIPLQAAPNTVNASSWEAGTWTVPLIDNWGKSLLKDDARAYLYNSTDRNWESWVLLSYGDV